MNQPPPLPGARRAGTGWWRRHWRWAMPLAVLSASAAAAAVVWLAVTQWAHWSRSSEPYQEAMRRARCSVELVAVLGEPIEDGFLPAGSMRSAPGGGGHSQFLVHLNGPRGHARMFLQATRQQGEWDYPMLYVLAGQSEPIDLTALDDAEAAQECALRDCRARGDCPLTAML
ncbi:membrane protein [Stenotrophomonas rhizophila]|nr:membrane protein [Stenotrophomonas rhizophila]